VEEAYELADAAQRGDDAKLLDELGDVLFQVHFLSLLLEERGAGDLGQVAEHIRAKLIRRHPHVFGEEAAQAAGLERPEAESRHQDEGSDAPRGTPLTAGEVLRNWDQIKTGEPGRERGLFAEVPENLPAPLYARKVQRRAASSGFDPLGAEEALEAVRATTDEADRDGSFESVGDLLFAAVNAARKLKVDPELALRASSERFRGRLEAAAELARANGEEWEDLDPDAQLDRYAQARLNEPPRRP
jgi:XTP/dITP diphosphohydrolase/tetrapyrrole methylase family protein/MazG family protein/ATP diphosphatase